MESLVEDYKNRGKELVELGFNGQILDLEPVVVETMNLPEDEEEAIQAIIKISR